MKAIILAGGFGSRLEDVLKDLPKPMAPVLGKPFLEHQIQFLKEQGVTDVILALHHMSEKIKSYFGNGLRLGVDITYSEEDTPLGTAGAIKKAQKYLDELFIVLNGDSYADIDIKKLIEAHKAKKSMVTIGLVKSKDASHFGNVVFDGERITDFIEKPDSNNAIINTGYYVFDPKIFDFIEADKKVSLEQEILPKLARVGLVYGYIHEGYFMDIGRPETYKQFKQDSLHSILIKSNNSVGYSMSKLNRTGAGILLVVDENKKLLGVLTDNIVDKFLLSGGRVEDAVSRAMVTDPTVAKTTDSESKIMEMLFQGIGRLPVLDENGVVCSVEFRTEKIKSTSFPVVRGRAPLRVSFAGGGTDIPYYFEKYGGVVVNATINKYCYATIIKRADSKIIINSDFDEEAVFDSRREMKYNGKFNLIKAIINIMKPDFGFEIYIHNDIPPGRGLGSSASMAVLIVSLLSYLQDIHYDDYSISEIAYRAERDELGIKGGWQDQYAAITGGFNYMEFGSSKNLIYPLRLKPEVVNELSAHLTLCYVGGSHFSGDIHTEQEKNFTINEEQAALNLNELKQLAIKVKDCLLTNELEEIGRILHESWKTKN